MKKNRKNFKVADLVSVNKPLSMLSMGKASARHSDKNLVSYVSESKKP